MEEGLPVFLRLFQVVVMSKKCPKYEYLVVLQGNYGYGHGWEDLTASTLYREVRQNLKEYRENEGGNYRIIQRRELIIGPCPPVVKTKSKSRIVGRQRQVWS